MVMEPPPPAEVLIPSLPNDVAVNILARVPHSEHPKLSLVSKPIKSLVSSPLFFTTRSLVSSTQQFLYLSLSTPLSSFSLFLFSLNDHDHNHNHRYSLLRVPPFPLSSTSSGSAYVSLGSTVFVLGGSIHDVLTPHVWTLDLRFNKWQPAPPMLVAREFPAAGVIDNKIYVFGGCVSDTWAEVFDPVIGKWEAVPSPIEMRKNWMNGSLVLDDKLYIMAEPEGIVYDPKNKVWESMESELDFNRTATGCVVNGILYCNHYAGNIQGFDVKEKVWKEVKGLDNGLPDFLFRSTIAHVGEKLVVVWEGFEHWMTGKDAEIWCAEIEVEKKRDNGELWGKIGWVDKVWTMPNGSYLGHCLAVSV